MSAVTPVTPPAPAVAAGIVLSLAPTAVIIVLAIVLNWGR